MWIQVFFKLISKVQIKLAPGDTLCRNQDKISLTEPKKMSTHKSPFPKISWTKENVVWELRSIPSQFILFYFSDHNIVQPNFGSVKWPVLCDYRTIRNGDPRQQTSYVSKKFGRGFTAPERLRHPTRGLHVGKKKSE